MARQPFGAVLAVEGPHELARGGGDHRACGQAPPESDRQMRRRLFLGMVLVESLALPQRRAGRVRRGLFLGRDRRLDPRRARRRRRSAPGQARRLRRRPQGAVFRRMGRPAGQGISGDARPAARRAARPPLRKGLRRHRAGGFAVRRMGGAAGAAGGHSDRHRRVRRALRRDRLRRARGDAGQGDRHLDLRHLRGLRRKAGARHSRHLRHRQGRGAARLLRHRGRPVGGRRHFQMVGRGRLRRATPPCMRR